ncbi:MAG: alpha/beta fold hydrolase [Myxococcaceae bacterium]
MHAVGLGRPSERTFALDVLQCTGCGQRRRVLAHVTGKGAKKPSSDISAFLRSRAPYGPCPRSPRTFLAPLNLCVPRGSAPTVPAPNEIGVTDTRLQGCPAARDITRLIDVLGGGSAAVCGHDWGGMTGWHTAMLSPGHVSRLMVLAAPDQGSTNGLFVNCRSSRKRQRCSVWVGSRRHEGGCCSKRRAGAWLGRPRQRGPRPRGIGRASG